MSIPVCGAPTPNSGTPNGWVIGPVTGQMKLVENASAAGRASRTPNEAGRALGGAVSEPPPEGPVARAIAKAVARLVWVTSGPDALGGSAFVIGCGQNVGWEMRFGAGGITAADRPAVPSSRSQLAMA